jgi:hypothetical protein
MVEKAKLIKEKIKYAGLGNMKSAYNYAYGWLKDQDYETVEELYTEKISGNAKDLEIKWASTKNLSDYFKSSIAIKWKVLGMTDVEVEVDGRKEKMNKFGEIEIEVTGTLEKDYESKWEGSAFNKFIREIYSKYVIPDRTRQREEDVKGLVQNFKEEMKAFLDLTGRK